MSQVFGHGHLQKVDEQMYCHLKEYSFIGGYANSSKTTSKDETLPWHRKGKASETDEVVIVDEVSAIHERRKAKGIKKRPRTAKTDTEAGIAKRTRLASLALPPKGVTTEEDAEEDAQEQGSKDA